MLELALDKIEKSAPISRRNSITDEIEDIFGLEEHCDQEMGKPRRNSLYEKNPIPLDQEEQIKYEFSSESSE